MQDKGTLAEESKVDINSRLTPEQIVQTAIQEDADGIGLSILSGAHMTLFPLVVEQLKAQGAEDIVFFGGGSSTDALGGALPAAGSFSGAGPDFGF